MTQSPCLPLLSMRVSPIYCRRRWFLSCPHRRWWWGKAATAPAVSCLISSSSALPSCSQRSPSACQPYPAHYGKSQGVVWLAIFPCWWLVKDRTANSVIIPLRGFRFAEIRTANRLGSSVVGSDRLDWFIFTRYGSFPKSTNHLNSYKVI